MGSNCRQCGAPNYEATHLKEISKETTRLIESVVSKLQWFQDTRPPGDGAVQEAIDNLNEVLKLKGD